MTIIFVDTNIILDVILKNESFWENSFAIFRLAEKNVLSGYISSSCVTDIFYIARKRFDIPTARDAIKRVLALFSVVGVDGDDLNGAMQIPINDLEDALQVWCAQKINADYIVTRNISDFKQSVIPAIEPAEMERIARAENGTTFPECC
jgi:predicted nucleic acid-binding protein